MTSLRNRMLAITALALAAICASALPAPAQDVCAGRFTLPSEVHWQGGTFPAGDYTFRMASVASPVITLKGPNGYEFVSAIVADKAAYGEQSILTIEHRGGKAFVRDMYLAQIGLRLQYRVPKAPKGELLALGPATTERILVAMK